MRIGEASNPGPEQTAARDNWGAFGAQRPHCGGFRHAIAPGFGTDAGAHDEDGDPMDHFTYNVVTVNVTAWSSALAFLASTDADVLMVQEHKLGPEASEEAVAWLRRRGWNAIMAPAEAGPTGGWSGGVAILARAHVGMGMPLAGSEVIHPARAVAARLEPPGGRPHAAVCVYLCDGKGLAQCNMDILKSVGTCLSMQGKEDPFIVGGDF